MKPLFIIPARGGSKGIPHKNIKPLGGRPLIAYTLDVARALAPTPRHILVSTDDPAIAEVARNEGVDVPYMRPAHLATDNAGSREVMLDAMEWAGKQGIDYDCVVLLQPTSPFRTVDDVQRTIDAWSPDIDMAVTVCPAASNPYYTCFEAGTDGYLHISKGDGLYTRRQDCPPVWEFNGAVYAITPDSLRDRPLGAFERRVAVPMTRETSVDLDTPLDWLVAEAIMADKPKNAKL